MVKAKRKLGVEDIQAAAPITTTVKATASKPLPAAIGLQNQFKEAHQATTAGAGKASGSKHRGAMQAAEPLTLGDQAPAKRQKQQQKQEVTRQKQLEPGSTLPTAAGTSGRSTNPASSAPANSAPTTPHPQQPANGVKANGKASGPGSSPIAAKAAAAAVAAAAAARPVQGKGAKHTPGGLKAKVIDKKKHTRGGERNKQHKAAAVSAAVAGATAGTATANGTGPIAAQAAAAAGSGSFKNKEKVLILSTRGITFRYRHLMTDLQALLPHCKKDTKLDTKSERGVINEVADMKGCSSVIFFEVRKRKDLYIWMAKAPTGPSVKFLVANVHTMAETKLSGNHLRGARPVLSFHAAFDEQPHLQLLKEMLTQVFATPRRHHKSKPFIDHVFAFSVADGRIWFRNYQIVAPQTGRKGEASAGDAAAAAAGGGSARPAGAAAGGSGAAAPLSATGSAASLVEVGPRLCLCPIKIFDGSFGGATLYENPAYVSPNAVRAAAKLAAAGRYKSKVAARAQRKAHVGANPAPQPEMAGLFQRGGSDDEDGDDDGEGSD